MRLLLLAGIAAVTISSGMIVGLQIASDSSTSTSAVAAVAPWCDVAEPEEQCASREPAADFDLRVPLISCGVSKAYTIPANQIVLMVNTGTVRRWIEAPAAGSPPMPGWLITPGDWFTFSFAVAGTYKIIVHHEQCTKAYAQRLIFTVT